jgi:hypothetical protein
MYKEVGHPIKADTEPHPKKAVKMSTQTYEETGDTREGKDQKEQIVMLQNLIWSLLMMVPVPNPKPAMHDIFVCEPRYTFHSAESAQC